MSSVAESKRVDFTILAEEHHISSLTYAQRNNPDLKTAYQEIYNPLNQERRPWQHNIASKFQAS